MKVSVKFNQSAVNSAPFVLDAIKRMFGDVDLDVVIDDAPSIKLVQQIITPSENVKTKTTKQSDNAIGDYYENARQRGARTGD